MENIKFYYLKDEYEPSIIVIDENKNEAYSVNEFIQTDIKKIEYPTKSILEDIIKSSINDGYDGSWESIKFILEEPKVLENLVLSPNRKDYILLIKYNGTESYFDKPIDILTERFWERFEDQTYNIAIKNEVVYNKGIEFLKSLSDDDAEKLLVETNDLTSKEYFYLILNKAGVPSNMVNNRDFSF